MLAQVGLIDADTPQGAGPSGDPSNLQRYLYGGTLIGLTWTNGDTTAATNAGRRITSADAVAYLRPNADISAGGWTGVGAGSGLYGRIDEETADDGSTYVTTTLTQAGGGTDTFEVALSNPANYVDPVETKTIRVRAYMNFSGATEPLTWTIKLVQGTTVIATWTDANDEDETWYNITKTLTQDQWEAVTDWDDVRIRITVAAPDTIEGSSVEYRVTQAYFSYTNAVGQITGFKSVSPGATSMETGDDLSDGYTYYARHVKNGQYGNWVKES